jgi:parallel beta-helix repeat protein
MDNNTIYDCEIEGLSVVKSYNSTLSYNKLYNCGFWISEDTAENYKSYSVTQNKVNDKPFGYSYDAIYTGWTAPSYGQWYCINFTHVGIHDWSASNVSYGLVVVFSTQVVIKNCTFANNTNAGLVFYQCNESQVWLSTFVDNEYGIWSIESDDLKIYENKFVDNKDGAFIETTDNLQVYDNIFDYEGGVCWTSILTNSCDNMLLDNNTLTGGQYVGIEVAESSNVQITNNVISTITDVGIYVYFTTNVNITYNSLIGNDEGIGLEEVTTARIIYNLLENNTYEGVYLDVDTSQVYVYWNTFRNNNGNISQASDDGTSNIWYNPDTLSGNWWSDYDFSGNYSISGTAGTFDLYPLNDPPFPIPEFGVLGFLSIFTLLSLSIALIQTYRKKN